MTDDRTNTNPEVTTEVAEGTTVTRTPAGGTPAGEFGGARRPVGGAQGTEQEVRANMDAGRNVQEPAEITARRYSVGPEHVRVMMLARHDTQLDPDLMVTNRDRHAHMVGASGGYQTGLMRTAAGEALSGRDSWDALQDLANAGLITYEVAAEQIKGLRRPLFVTNVAFTDEGQEFLSRVEETVSETMAEEDFEGLLLTSDATSKRTLEYILRDMRAEDTDAYPTFELDRSDAFTPESLDPSTDQDA